MPLLELIDISKEYKQGGLWGKKQKVQALRAVNLKIEKGQCLALVGPSGSGKSTLGRLCLGLEKPDSGHLIFKGCAYQNLNKKEWSYLRRNIQVVFQNSHGAVNPRFLVKDIIREPLLNFKYKESFLKGQELDNRILDLLEMVGLGAEHMDKLPHQCSGGELQRVCIARALALNPLLIVLDEALSSLDMLNQSKILDLLDNIKAKFKTSFLFISHDLRVVGQVADSLAFMEKGEILHQFENLQDPKELKALQKSKAFISLSKAVLPPCPRP